MASTTKVHFVVDEAKRPDSQKFETFVADVKGRTIEFGDPAEIAYQDLLSCETPMEFWKYTVSEKDRDHIAETRMESWRLGALLNAYLEHYQASDRLDKDVRAKLGF
jgi:hypothetical protein